MDETTNIPGTLTEAVGPAGVLPDPGARDPLRVALRGLQQGFAVMIPDGTVLLTKDGPLSKAQILVELSDSLAVYTELDAHRRAVQQALTQIESAAAANRRRVQQLKDLLLGYFGRGDARLGQFGMTSREGPRPLTPEAKVLRAQRVRETRALRHTMGKRQKAAIKAQGKYAVTVQTHGGNTALPSQTATEGADPK
jgi:hypothetical protein